MKKLYKLSFWHLVDDVTEHTNNLRSIQHKLEASHINELWLLSDEQQRKEVIAYIYNGDKNKLKEWIDTHPSTKVKDWSYNRLRDRAKDIGVKNYSRMTREQLIEYIVKIEAENEETGDAGSNPRDTGES